MRTHSIFLLFYLLIGLGTPAVLKAQVDSSQYDQLNVFKINALQFAINEARVSYEMQVRPGQSVEVGAGYIYPNSFWFNDGGTEMLATGGGLYLSYRKYRVPKRYFSAPVVTGYLSPLLFIRYSGYNREWLLFEEDRAQFSECAQFSERIQQYGLVFRVGGQTTQGRFVLDFYSGLGLKLLLSDITLHALNENTNVCEILPSSDLTEVRSNDRDFEAVFNIGLKLGLRRKNRNRNYEERGVRPAPESDEPPKY